MLIWIASYPRSGNTFFRYVLAHIYGLPTYEKYSWGPNHIPLDMEGFEQLKLSLAEMNDDAARFFVKTHDLPDDDNPAVYIVRDGRDALISHAHFIIEYDLRVTATSSALFRKTLQAIIESDDSFGGWSNNVRAWTSRAAPTAIVKFEDLIAAPVRNARMAMKKIGFDLPEIRNSGIMTFGDLHRLDSKFFRKGNVGGWYKEMPSDLHELFWQRHGDTMRRLGYRRPYLRILWWTVRSWCGASQSARR